MRGFARFRENLGEDLQVFTIARLLGEVLQVFARL